LEQAEPVVRPRTSVNSNGSDTSPLSLRVTCSTYSKT